MARQAQVPGRVYANETATRQAEVPGCVYLNDTATVSAAITGTATSANESDIVAGGKTVIITLTGDRWVASGATFNAQRQGIIDGMDSAQSELLGWDNVVKALQGVAGVVRTSSTVVTITLDAQVTYSITANETITVTVPATAVDGGVAIVGSPTFTITEGGAAAATYSGRGIGRGLARGIYR